MIPISLTIKGLYSYQEPTCIDFRNLTGAGLFGIFGAVGSGKSTILEAISFALYGETERLNSRDSRSYNMMNLKSNDLLIEFTFTCGDCDDKYKFTVSAKRNKKNFVDAGTFDRKSYLWQEQWVPTSLNAERILGLSYHNFKRTIIIPQGKFHEFLQLKESHRVQMLKEIFSLEKFELSPKVGKLTGENNLRISNVEGQMQSLPLYNGDLLKEKKAHINELDKAVKELTNNLKDNQDEEKMLQDLKSLFADVNAKTIALKLLHEKEKDINKLDRQIKEFEKCEQVFKYPIESRNKIEQNITIQQRDAKKLQADKAIIKATLITETDKVNKLNDSYTNREILLQKVTELEKIVSIKSLQDNITTLYNRIEKGDIAVKKEETNLEDVKKQLASVKDEIASIEQSLPDTALLISINKWFNNKKQLETNLTKTEQEVSDVTGKFSKVKADIETKLKQLPNEIKLEGFPGSLSIVKDEMDRLTKEYNQQLQVFKDERNHLNLSQKLDEFAKDLTDDSECPLCGSIHHPKIFSVVSVTEDLEQTQTVIEEIEQKKQILNTALINLSGSYSDYETYSAQCNKKEQGLDKEKSFLQKFTDSFSFAGYSLQDEELVQKQLDEIEEKNTEIKKLRKQRDEKDTQVEVVNKKISTYKAGIEKFKTDKAQLEGQLETLKTQILLHALVVEIKKTVSELTTNATAFKSQHAEVTKEFENADKAVQENNKVLATIVGRIDELENQLNTNVSQQQELDDQIIALLTKEGYQSEQDVEQVLATKLNIKQEKGKVEIFRRELHAATVQLSEATAKVEGKEYNEANHVLLQQTIQNLARDISEKTEKLVKEKHELLELEQRMQTRLELQKDLDKLTLRAENLKVLSNLFRSSGFVNYVSSVYLQNLVNAANQRFHKMTGQKLMLDLAEDNSFRVRDFMNNGQLRSVKTLSGGQTFQAALSLALALAENIQHLTKSKQNFFFLDEGFGSLDKEALAIVFDTLKSLRKENRIVGVISHINEMQQEIQVNLTIVNDIDRGSIVTTSWN
ncbi:MAG: AAA family ATPase [Chitinophagaceae bacterium]|nr:AAA family ATPase [Chitinophagaceae bacterium]